MARGRVSSVASTSHAGRGGRAVALSISLSFLLMTPLWLGLDGPSGGTSLPIAAPGRILGLAATPSYNPTPDPLPGEVLVRFDQPTALALRNELVAATSPDGHTALDEAHLIGARLSPDETRQAVPALADLFDRYALSAADAIYPQLGMWRLKIDPQAAPLTVAQALMERAGVQYAEADYPVYGFSREPNDPYYLNNQAALRQIKAPQAWDISTGSSDITIAVLDTGLAYGHPELGNKIIYERGKNFVAEPANEFAWDDNGHGTFVAGVAAADTNNGLGIAGVSWGAKLISVKVLDEGEQGSIATLSMGLAYVANQPVNIANMSTGGPVRSKIMEDVAQNAYDKGLIMVAAAGNSGKPEFNYPAAFDTVIAVGASNEFDQPADFSTYGPFVSLVAPGVDIFSLNWASGRDYASGEVGTSFSCPFVAGAVALMLSVNPGLTPAQVRNILENTTDPLTVSPSTGPATPSDATTIGSTPVPTALPAFGQPTTSAAISGNSLGRAFNPKTGWGRLNVYAAVLAASNGDLPPSRRNAITGLISGLPSPQEATIILEPGDERFPDATGQYHFNNLPPGKYSLTILSRKYNLKTTTFSFTFQSQNAEKIAFGYDFTNELGRLYSTQQPIGAFAPVAQKPTDTAILYFPDGHTLGGPFRTFWEKQGGLPIFGYPISEELQENGLTVQYFERAVLEYHAEYALTRSQVQPRLLGTLFAQSRPNDDSFKRLPASNIPNYFTSTGHTLAEPFLSYWKANGGLALFGYPISEPRRVTDNGKTRLIQYFERCRMDYFPELEGTPYYIQLGLLGRDSAQSQRLLGKK